jgi:hypothetical protein
MTHAPLNRTGVSRAAVAKPGLLQPGLPRFLRADRGGNQEWSSPLSITLPAAALASLVLWAGIAMAIRALI